LNNNSKQTTNKHKIHFAWLEQISLAGNSERRSSDKSDQLTNSSYNLENNKNQKCIHLTNNNNSATTPGLCTLQQNLKNKNKKQKRIPPNQNYRNITHNHPPKKWDHKTFCVYPMDNEYV